MTVRVQARNMFTGLLSNVVSTSTMVHFVGPRPVEVAGVPATLGLQYIVDTQAIRMTVPRFLDAEQGATGVTYGYSVGLLEGSQNVLQGSCLAVPSSPSTGPIVVDLTSSNFLPGNLHFVAVFVTDSHGLTTRLAGSVMVDNTPPVFVGLPAVGAPLCYLQVRSAQAVGTPLPHCRPATAWRPPHPLVPPSPASWVGRSWPAAPFWRAGCGASAPRRPWASRKATRWAVVGT